MKKPLFLILPLAIIVVLAGLILALPSFVASQTHRANMEAFASALTGRQVNIAGSLSLNLFPEPQITATRITLTGPDTETITARSLTLNISLLPLLRGRLIAQNLALDAPTIAFPWPLPGGAKSIAPPPWLAALHAEISNGDISLGAAHFTQVNADIFTNTGGALSVSGTGNLADNPITLSFALGAVQLTGAAPISANATLNALTLNFSGSLNAESTVAGQLDLSTPTLSGIVTLAADGTTATATQVQLTEGQTTVSGTAAFVFAHPALTATLTAQNLNLDTLPLASLPPIPIALDLSVTNLTWSHQSFPALQTTLDLTPHSLNIKNLTASLPSGATLTGAGTQKPDRTLSGNVALNAPDLPGLLVAYGIKPPPAWTSANLDATLSGTPDNLAFAHLTGRLGPTRVTGNLILASRNLSGVINLDHFDLLPFHNTLGKLPITLDGELTAATATLGSIPLTHLLIDGTVNHSLNLRHVSASLFGGLAAGSLSFDPSGALIAAQGFVNVPSATSLAALLPFKLPPGLTAPRLSATIAAAQRPGGWLATALTATLGDFTLTASPFFNFTTLDAQGPVTLRHPDAIAAFKTLGLPSNQAFPGPGSIALRASILASPKNFGLPDVVLSLGSLTASGRVLSLENIISGDIQSGTLALPPFNPDWQLPWADLDAAQGKLDLSAGRVLYAGNTILLHSNGILSLAPNTITLAVTHASLAGGNLTAAVAATASLAKPPALTLHFTATQLDAAALHLPVDFPYRLPTGTITATGALAATGYAAKTWTATLAGTTTLTATHGTITGFNLAAIPPALTSKHPENALRAALSAGTTPFTALNTTLTISLGNATVTTAALATPSGTATATGAIDLYDHNVALHLAFTPLVTPPLTLDTTVLGPWASPSRYPKLKPALAWKPEPVLKQ